MSKEWLGGGADWLLHCRQSVPCGQRDNPLILWGVWLQHHDYTASPRQHAAKEVSTTTQNQSESLIVTSSADYNPAVIQRNSGHLLILASIGSWILNSGLLVLARAAISRLHTVEQCSSSPPPGSYFRLLFYFQFSI